MTRLLSSDWHCDPWELRPEVVQWLKVGMAQRAELIGVGDLLNILPWGEKRWEMQSYGAIDQLKRILGGYLFNYLLGNHDPDEVWLKKMFADSPNIIITPKLHIDGVDIRHGHETFIDWAILRHFAPEVVNVAARYFPQQWYDFCRRMGWMPSTFQGTDEYHAVVLGVWMAAFKYSQKQNCSVIRGHTHHSAVLYEPGPSHRAPNRYRVHSRKSHISPLLWAPHDWVFADCGALGSTDANYLEWGERMTVKVL